MNTRDMFWQASRATARTGSGYVSELTNVDDQLSSQRQASIASSPRNRPQKQVPLKFFLVEDNVVIRDNLAETLRELVGAEVVGSSDTQNEATQWLCDPSHDWDVAVIDIFLKHGNGVQVVASLQGYKRQRQIIVLSNYASPDVRGKCLRFGADAVFDKSTELDDLIEFCVNVQTH